MADSSAPRKVWASLITNFEYIPGLLCLEYSLRQTQSQYPFVALYTDSFPEAGHEVLAHRGITAVRVDYLTPPTQKDFSVDARFTETWTKLTVFGLTAYDRLVLLDGDMIVRRNIDELMELPLDSPAAQGRGSRVFAASHACACNPLKKPSYPPTWIPENCAFTKQHAEPERAQVEGTPCGAGVGMLNSGLLVVVPSAGAYEAISTHLATSEAVKHYSFPDQELLSNVFQDRWVPLPYVYNALKTLRWKGIHDAIWRDDQVKVVHYILSPKPWSEDAAKPPTDETHEWWRSVNQERLQNEKQKGVEDWLNVMAMAWEGK